MTLFVHPGAESDLLDAAGFYEREGSPALAARFIGEFKRVCELLATHPDIGTARSRGNRGVSLNMFPYTIIYRVVGDDIRVLVVKHDKRRPSYGATRT